MHPFDCPQPALVFCDDDAILRPGDDLQPIIRFEPEILDQRFRQPDSQAVAPFGDPHHLLQDIQGIIDIICGDQAGFKAAAEGVSLNRLVSARLAG